MKLSNHQFEFLKDVARLIGYCELKGIKITGGELWRTPEQQALYVKKGLSKTNNSLHLKKLAIDFSFFINDVYIADGATLKKQIQHVGDYWESLNELNKWGGNFKTFLDCPHFERSVM